MINLCQQFNIHCRYDEEDICLYKSDPTRGIEVIWINIKLTLN